MKRKRILEADLGLLVQPVICALALAMGAATLGAPSLGCANVAVDEEVRSPMAQRRAALNLLKTDPRWAEPEQREFLCHALIQSKRRVLAADGKKSLLPDELASLPATDPIPAFGHHALMHPAEFQLGHTDLLAGLNSDPRWKMPTLRGPLCHAMVQLQQAMQAGAI